MKTSFVLLFASCLAVFADSEERLNKQFTAQPGGRLVVTVDFGAIEITTHPGNEIVVDVFRRVAARNKAAEQDFLRERPILFSEDGSTVTIQSRAKRRPNTWRQMRRTEAKYTISLPAKFNADLKTAGGPVWVRDLSGDLSAESSGGGLTFEHLRGRLHGGTSGGPVNVLDCQGDLDVNTSGGGISVAGGSGSLHGHTSGGAVVIKDFGGPVNVGTSGGGITIENVAGKVAGSTSGGPIVAILSKPLAEEVKLETSGAAVTLRVPAESAFDLDASTSGGGVSSDLPVTAAGKMARDHLRGSVNGGGHSVVLRTSGGNIHVKRL